MLDKKKLTPLTQWLNSKPDHLVATTSGKQKTSYDFMFRIQLWMQVIGKHKGTRWAVYHDDAYEFLAIVFALWQLQRVACIPGDNRSSTVDRLGEQVDGFIGEFPNKTISIEEYQSIQIESSISWIEPFSNDPALEIYTSGSTGDPKPITKQFYQLERELEALELLWPSHPGSVVISTVSHQHLYGMTFRLFWPLSSGRCFEQTICKYPEDILNQANCYSSFCLISSPSHLSRMNPTLDWEKVSGRCLYTVSSAAWLSKEDSLAASKVLGSQVKEIYGSSETGAIAWREQTQRDLPCAWQALPTVNLSTSDDGCLKVNSPYQLSTDGFTLADRVAFDGEHQFTLLGRADRVAKVEGKRISLDAIEHELLRNKKTVKGVKVITLNRKRVETAVVMQLTEQGRVLLNNDGRKIMISHFKKELMKYFDAVVIPRRWRFVKELPYNPQGKIPLQSLRQLFERHPEKKVNKVKGRNVKSLIQPKVLNQSSNGHELKITCYIPKELKYFNGHFEKNAILPGIVQVHWAEDFGRQFLAVKGCFIRLEVIKFMRVIIPATTLIITLKYDNKKNKLTFSFDSDQGPHSSGRICFE